MNEKMRLLGAKKSAIRELFEYAKERRARLGEDSVYDFSIGNPSVPAPAEVTETLRRLMDTDPCLLHGYTSAPGTDGVRGAIAEHIRTAYDAPADARLIYMTAGAAAALTITFRALLCPGDEVIVPAPFFPEYRVFIENADGVLRDVPTEEGTFDLDVGAIGAAIGEHTAAVLINTPNNPTGRVYSKETLVRLADLLRKKSKEIGRPIYLISDEPYRELLFGGKAPVFLTSLYENTVVCYSYSKSLSLPGERIGYVLVSPECRDAADVFDAVCGAGRSLGYVCAPALFQKMIESCVGCRSDVSVYETNRDLLYAALCDLGFSPVYPEGAFYLFLKSPEADAAAFCERAKELGLLFVPSDSFGIGGYVRIATCKDTQTVKKSLDAFRALAKQYGLTEKKAEK